MSNSTTNNHGAIKGRGAITNTSGRFESYSHEAFDDGWEGLPYERSECFGYIPEDTRGGKDYDSRFGERFRGTGAFADIIAQRFKLACKKLALKPRDYSMNCGAFYVPARSGDQLGLF